MAVTAYQERRIRELRQRGIGYRTIAAELGISRDTVRNFCTSHALSGIAADQSFAPANVCPCCGGEIVQPHRGRPRRFCSDACCRKWWAAHPDAIRQNPEAQRRLKCAYCGKAFTVCTATPRGAIVVTTAIFATASGERKRGGTLMRLRSPSDNSMITRPIPLDFSGLLSDL